MYSDPKLKDAFTKAIKHYFDDQGLDEYDKTVGSRKFNKSYFDTLENDLTGEKPDEINKDKVSKKTNSKKNKTGVHSNSLRLK